MSFVRDRDRATRGVGAIAARDRAQPRQRAWEQARMAQATARRDHAMAQVTRGALGLVPSVVRTVGDHRPRPTAPTSASQPSSTTTSSNAIVHDHRRPVAAQPGQPAAPAPGAPIAAPPAAPAPVMTSAPPPAAAAPSTGSGTGGGGGSVTLTLPESSSGPAVPTAPGPTLPDIPDATPPDNTNRNLLIFGGIAIVGAFLLFRNRGGQ